MRNGFNRVKRAVHGLVVYNPNDKYVGRSLQKWGEYSNGETELFSQLLHPGDLAVEIGANIGAHTLPLARMVGPAGGVFAFEPQRVLFQTLCGTIALNSLTNVWAYPYAVGDEEGTVQVPIIPYDQPSSFGGLELGPDADWKTNPEWRVHTEEVPLVTLDSVLADRLGRLRLLKIDAEGMEIQVLRGAGKLIEKTRPAIYCEADRKSKSPAIVSWLRPCGYDLYWHITGLGFDDLASIMILALPREWKTETNLDPVTDPVHRMVTKN
jgi:FkbM family methyltransferase